MRKNIEEAAIVVSGVKEPHITVNITLTSPVMREQLLQDGSGGKEIFCRLPGYREGTRGREL